MSDKTYVEEVQNGFSFRFEITETLFEGQSDFQKVEVVQTKRHGRMLLNDGFVMLCEKDEFIYHEMMAHVALFTHRNPRRVLIIGGGDGGTAREVLRHPTVELCEMVEIDAMVIEACRQHLPVTAKGMEENSRFRLHVADGVKFVEGSQEPYDVILVDSTDPIGPAQPLFGHDFYKNIFRLLSPDGLVLSQAESPFYNAPMQEKLGRIVSELFPICRFLNFSNMTYPGGLWSFVVGSKKYHPVNDLDLKRQQKLALPMNYYNAEVHRSSFSLPQFQKDRLGLSVKDQ